MPRSDPERRRQDRERHRRRTQARRTAGLCSRCGRQSTVDGGLTCERCRRKRRQADRKRAARCRAAGIKRVRDPQTRKVEYRRARERAEGRLARGLCASCGHNRNEPDRRLCAACGERRRERERERYARARASGHSYGGKQPDRKRRTARRRSRKRRHQRREASLCIRCGKSAPVKGGSSCARCLEIRRASDRRTYADRRAKGQCTRCSTATFEGAPLCGPCIVLEARYSEKKRATGRQRYALRRAAWVCTHCGKRPSFGASRCEHCAKRAWERTEQVRVLPDYPPSYTVVEIATGEPLGVWERWEDVVLCLSFARLSFEEVEILHDHTLMRGAYNMFG